MRLNIKKITTSGLWVTLLMHLGCCASEAPVVIGMFANSLFDPEYQIGAYTGNSVQPPASAAIASLMYSGYTTPTTAEDNAWNANSNYSAESNYVYRSAEVAMSSVTNMPYYGMFLGSLVANGYVTNVTTTNVSSPQPLSVGLSGSYVIDTPSSGTLYANAHYAVGLADLAELCQRYGVYTALVNQPAGGIMPAPSAPDGLQAPNNLYSITLPVSNPFALTPLTINTNSSGQQISSMGEWISAPYVTYPNTTYQRIIYSFVPNWAEMYYSYPPANLYFYAMLPSVLSYQSVRALQSIVQQLPEGIVAPADGGNNLSDWVNPPMPASTVIPYLRAFSCDQSVPSSVANSSNSTMMFLQKPLPQFAQLSDWFTIKLGMQISTSGFAPALPYSLVNMNNATANNFPYKAMMSAITTLPASVTIGSSSSTTATPATFAAPATLGSTDTPFYPEPLFVPLMMADPLWVTQATSNKSVPYEYPNMKVYEWGWNNQWVLEEMPTQKISCAGDPVEGYGGGMSPVTAFNPQKSPMSDYYSMLSF